MLDAQRLCHCPVARLQAPFRPCSAAGSCAEPSVASAAAAMCLLPVEEQGCEMLGLRLVRHLSSELPIHPPHPAGPAKTSFNQSASAATRCTDPAASPQQDPFAYLALSDRARYANIKQHMLPVGQVVNRQYHFCIWGWWHLEFIPQVLAQQAPQLRPIQNQRRGQQHLLQPPPAHRPKQGVLLR